MAIVLDASQWKWTAFELPGCWLALVRWLETRVYTARLSPLDDGFYSTAPKDKTILGLQWETFLLGRARSNVRTCETSTTFCRGVV